MKDTEGTGRTARIVTVALLLLAGIGLLAPAAGAQDEGQGSGEEQTEGRITVEQTPGEGGEGCIDYVPKYLPADLQELVDPLPDGITWSTSGTALDAGEFSVTVTLDERLCEPIEVHAVVYAMPGGGQAWPQTLAEKETFTLDGPGTTVVTFRKDCDPAQFDLVTGETPEVIFPPLTNPERLEGVIHGPLLIPDVASSLQYFGNGPGCTTTTTTTTTTTPSILGSTTLPGGSVTTVSGTSNTVAVLSQGGTQAPRAAALAFTGDTSDRLALLGGALLAAGVALSLLSRRTRAGV